MEVFMDIYVKRRMNGRRHEEKAEHQNKDGLIGHASAKTALRAGFWADRNLRDCETPEIMGVVSLKNLTLQIV